MSVLNIQATRFLRLKIIDTSAASSLLVTVLGALLVRHQFVLGFRPRISYKSMYSQKQSAYSKNEFCETWQVKIRNVGVGAAIINRCEFDFEILPIRSSRPILSFDEVVREFGKKGLTPDRDYWIENITSGFTLAPNEDYNVFEIKTEYIKKLKRLTMILHFQGFLGEKYYRKVFLMPQEAENVAANKE